MSPEIVKNEEGEGGMPSNERVDNLFFLSWLTEEETIRDEGTMAGKINAKPDPAIQLIDTYHEWQYIQFYRKMGILSVEASEKNLLRLAQLKEDIHTIKTENFRLTRDFPLDNGSFLKLFGFFFMNLFFGGLLFYLLSNLLKPLSQIGIKWLVIYSLNVLLIGWIILQYAFPKGMNALKSFFAFWVEKRRVKEKMKYNHQAMMLKENELYAIESKYITLPTHEEWEKLKTLRKDLFLSEFHLSNLFYTHKK